MFKEIIYKILISNISKYLPIYLQEIGSNKNILDLGCGNGLLDKMLLQNNKGLAITGVDVGNFLWEKKAVSKHLIYNGYKVPFDDNTFDCVLVFLTLHHSQHPEHTLQEAIRVTKKNVLVLEEVFSTKFQKLFMIVYDLIVNFLIFGQFISTPKFETIEHWSKLVNKTKVDNFEVKLLSKSNFIFPTRILIKITK